MELLKRLHTCRMGEVHSGEQDTGDHQGPHPSSHVTPAPTGGRIGKKPARESSGLLSTRCVCQAGRCDAWRRLSDHANRRILVVVDGQMSIYYTA